MLTIELTPNEKYRRVIGGYRDDHPPETDYSEWSSDEQQAADAYTEAVDSAPTMDDLDLEEDEIEPLTWNDISVSSDPDLVKQMATYFDGMDVAERTDRLRAKLRLLSVTTYVNVQMAARREQGFTTNTSIPPHSSSSNSQTSLDYE